MNVSAQSEPAGERTEDSRVDLPAEHSDRDGRRLVGRAPHFVQSLERGLAVLRAFSADEPELSLSDVARRTGLPRAAARRSLLTLADLGYVSAEGRAFSLRPRVLELGYAYLSSSALPQVALPHLERLSEQVHESSSVAVLDGDDVVHVARVPTERIMSVAISVGTRLPAYATSLGRVLLAGLPPHELDDYLDRVDLRRLTRHTVASVGALLDALQVVRAQGWALVDQELEEGLASVAAPLHDAGRVVAALDVSTHASRLDRPAIEAGVVGPLLRTASRIEAEMRATGTRWP